MASGVEISSSRRRNASDPNHPPGLAIRPSSIARWQGKARDLGSAFQTDHHETARCDQDTWLNDSVADIEQFGIAGRIWEAAYLFVRYLQYDDAATTLEYDPPCPLFDRRLGSGTEEQLPPTQHILELGSGVGLVGLACARQFRRLSINRHPSTAGSLARPAPDARIVLTDLENVQDLMQRNASAAGFPSYTTNPNVPTQEEVPDVEVLVRSLPWGSSSHARAVIEELSDCRRTAGPSSERSLPRTTATKYCEQRPIDCILCSDLVYFPELLPPLMRSLIQLTNTAVTATRGSDDSGGLAEATWSGKPPAHTRLPPPVLIAYKVRSMAKEEPFWVALGNWFDVQIVDCRYCPSRPASELPTRSPMPKGEGGGSWGEWHRFGSWKCDLESAEEGEQKGTSADEPHGPSVEPSPARSDDEYFLFVAQRKAHTQDCEPPDDDDLLMTGSMYRRGAADDDDMVADGVHVDDAGAHATSQQRGTLIPGQGGADFLEWALMGSMDI